ncbi:MAG: biopolymer transporter ExbD [Candidatus Sumerlaeia bacterium]|nr:biopolymer transporter ExbD [Candidatus Sumerlaeia bacterium]
MARRRRPIPARLADSGVGLNMTPLLDIIFNLLFFFLLATTIRDRSHYLEVTLPTSTTGEARVVEKHVPVVSLLADGRLMLDGQEASTEELLGRLRRMVQLDEAKEVVVESDAGIPVQRFFDAADICRQAGIPVVTPRVTPSRRPL